MKLRSLNVIVKKIMQMALLTFIALVLSGLSMFIKIGTDITEKDTIGIISRWGFPIHYKITAPGLAWAQFDGARWGLNTIAWLAVLVAIWMFVAFKRSHRKGARVPASCKMII